MGVYRIYKGEDNKSRIEEMTLSHPILNSPRTASSIFFKEFPPGTFLDWHPAPRRQIVIILSGRLEHGFRDGSRYKFGPGDVRLLEDTTGEGHTTRVVGNEKVLVAVVPLADQDS
jgi:quercetin dioxygenase-like cupin family protein